MKVFLLPECTNAAPDNFFFSRKKAFYGGNVFKSPNSNPHTELSLKTGRENSVFRNSGS